MKGLEQRRVQHRIGAKVDRVQALVTDVRTVKLIIPSSTWVGDLAPAELRDLLLCLSLEEELGFCFITALLFDCLLSVPAFLCSLKIINY